MRESGSRIQEGEEGAREPTSPLGQYPCLGADRAGRRGACPLLLRRGRQPTDRVGTTFTRGQGLRPPAACPLSLHAISAVNCILPEGWRRFPQHPTENPRTDKSALGGQPCSVLRGVPVFHHVPPLARTAAPACFHPVTLAVASTNGLACAGGAGSCP